MDTPKRDVFWLERFPPDIWAYIVFYLPGEQLGRLMMTGARCVRQRLKSPRVVKSINLGRDLFVFKSIPMFLNDFPSLEKLSIHSFKGDWSWQSLLKLDSIPFGVRKLELSGNWNESDVLLLGEPSERWTLSKHLPRLEALKIRSLHCPSLFWMTDCQSLTNLSIRHWNGAVELPSSLNHFEAMTVAISKHSFVAKLPPTLESFVVTSPMRGVDLLLPLLPPSTRKLYLGAHIIDKSRLTSLQNLLEQLPPSLTIYTVPHSMSNDFDAYPKIISLLPTTLTELDILPPLPCSAWFLVPRNLTTLTIRSKQFLPLRPMDLKLLGGFEPSEGTTLPFELLPRSLTSLRFLLLAYKSRCFCGPPAMSHQSYFPPHLTHLNLSSVQLSPETTKLLPSSLTHLKIGNLCEKVCQHLPNDLKALISESTLISPNLIKFLPKSLTLLHLRYYARSILWYDENTGQVLDSINILSEYSIHQKCISEGFDWKDVPPLPPTLLYLELPDAQELGDLFLLQRLPNLLKLNLSESKHFSDVSIPLLSRHLTSLDFMSSDKISGKSFPFLPRCLTYLSLFTSTSIFDSDIQHLPRTLKVVAMACAIHLTELCIADLPPHVESLDVSCNAHITPSSFAKLPCSLRSSRIDVSAEFEAWYIKFGEIVPK